MSMSGTDAAQARRFPRSLSELSATRQRNPGQRADPAAMSSRIRRLVVFVGATGVLALAGCGGATPSSSPSSAQGAADQPQQQQGAQGPGAGTRDLSALADKLGVSTTQLQKAMQAVGPPSPDAAGQNEADRIAALAKRSASRRPR
jgi:hypothetical protein